MQKKGGGGYCKLFKSNAKINLMKYNFPKHFYFSTACLDQKKGKGDNILLITSERPAICAGVFTNNSFCGAPVIVSKKHLKASAKDIRAILVNAGVSNVATGEKGLEDARECATLVGEQINCSLKNVLVASTGVIGQFLPMQKIREIIPGLLKNKKQDVGPGARAILTTDTAPKIAQAEVGKATILGIAKGAGMIAPNMATMLSFIVTDAKISQVKLQKMWSQIIEDTFNMLSIDNCESTSDMAFVLANGEYPVDEKKFALELFNVAESLTRQLARDGEGATKLMESVVNNASNKEKARTLAKSIITSDLVKTAVHGRDANWGRIIQAMGATKIPINANKLIIKIDGVVVFEKGAPAKNIDESRIFAKDIVKIEINLNSGKSQATAWGCDLSKEYISINADYRT